VKVAWLVPDFSSAIVTFAHRRHRLAGDREHRHRPLAAVGHERQRALAIDEMPAALLPASSVAMTAGGELSDR